MRAAASSAQPASERSSSYAETTARAEGGEGETAGPTMEEGFRSASARCLPSGAPAAAAGFEGVRGARSAMAKASSKPAACTTTSPAAETAIECPSKTMESFPPTRLHSAIGIPCLLAAAEAISRRRCGLPRA